MTLEEMIDDIQEGQMAIAMLNGEKWFVIKLKGELYDCDVYGDVLGLSLVSLRNFKAEWSFV